MLIDRIIGAFTFRKGVYAEVERDTSFTQTAWILVAVIAFLGQLGATANVATERNIVLWLVAAIISTIFAVVGFAVAAFIISWVGSSVFHAQVDFGEMVRVLGLAYVWNVVGFIGILAILSPALVCVLSPAIIIAAILGFIAWLVAAKEALDLEWLQTIVTLIVGWIVGLIIGMLAGIVLGLIGLTAAGIGSMFGG